jgi:hypothetical protein
LQIQRRRAAKNGPPLFLKYGKCDQDEDYD